MEKIIKQDDSVMKILGVQTIQRIICETDKGTLKLQIRKGDTNYHLILDSVPLSKDDNKELMDLLFPANVLEVPQVNKLSVNTGTTYKPTLSKITGTSNPKKK